MAKERQYQTAYEISACLVGSEMCIRDSKYARARLGKAAIRALRIGDNVTFNSVKQGRTVTGFVTKIAIKYVTVQTTTGLWRVPANMLTVVEDAEFA